MDLNEITHFLKRAVSFKTRDAGTVTWASERPAPRAPRPAASPRDRSAPAVSGATRALGRPGPTHGEAAALVRPVLPSALRPVSLPSAFASQMLPRRRLACLEAALLAVPPPGPLNPGPRHPAAEPQAAPAHVTGSLTA